MWSKFCQLFMFNRNDRDGVIVIMLVIITCVVLYPHLADEDTKHNDKNNNPSYRHSDGKKDYYYAVPDNKGKERLFYFDPNTADSTQLLALGLKPWQVRSIYRYRAKGGRFRKPTDFAQLYGLTLEKYKQLEPYIRIEKEQMARDYYAREGSSYDNALRSSASSDSYHRPSNNTYNNTENNVSDNTASRVYDTNYERIPKLRHGETVDINTADTTLLKRIPGIGSYFAMRIVELRQRKGMFVSPEQLLSIRNFPEHSLTYMTASQNFLKIHINRATFKELHAHPLLSYTQASDIIKLRRTSGTIRSIQDLSFISSITDEQLKRLAPYLVFD